MPPEREIMQRKRRKIEQDINLPVTLTSTREHVPLQSAVGVETARTMIQVMKHQMILRGNIPGNDALHHHLSDLAEGTHMSEFHFSYRISYIYTSLPILIFIFFLWYYCETTTCPSFNEHGTSE
uniref:Uncharacterized protein n=1 Tax=Salix viminalis TaxID=40686 RepID=A0A6N2L7T8_SALVM